MWRITFCCVWCRICLCRVSGLAYEAQMCCPVALQILHTLLPGSSCCRIAVEASSTKCVAPKDINAHIHIPCTRASSCSSLLRRASLPSVVDKECITAAKEGSIQLIQGVLPLEQSLGGDRIIPDDLTVGIGLLASCCEHPAIHMEACKQSDECMLRINDC